MDDLEQRILKIEERNQKVEADKDWETSGFRRILLAIFTYIAIGAYLWVIDVQSPWVSAVVPAIAFMLSTLTIPFFKARWIRRRERD